MSIVPPFDGLIADLNKNLDTLRTIAAETPEEQPIQEAVADLERLLSKLERVKRARSST